MGPLPCVPIRHRGSGKQVSPRSVCQVSAVVDSYKDSEPAQHPPKWSLQPWGPVRPCPRPLPGESGLRGPVPTAGAALPAECPCPQTGHFWVPFFWLSALGAGPARAPSAPQHKAALPDWLLGFLP